VELVGPSAVRKNQEFVMPLYEYLCRSCGKGFEMLRRMKDADADLKCPNCHSNKVERQLSTFAAGGCGTAGSRRFT
jgi:putative FmdB family regulatory protein